MSTTLDLSTAYAAMFEFLAQHYERTGSDDLGALLGSMSLLDDNSPADPALWLDWMGCVEKVVQNKGHAEIDFSSPNQEG